MSPENIEPLYRKSNRCWAVLIGACLMTAVGFTVPITCWSIFVTPIINDFGLTYTQTSLYMVATTFAGMISMVIAPYVLKAGAGKVVTISGIIASLAFFMIAAKPSAAMIVVAGFVGGLAYPLTSLYTAPVLIKNWFYKSQATMTGIAMAFIGVGGVILSPITSSLIAAHGWRYAMIVVACIVLVVQVCVGAFLVRLSPIPMGLLPHGATEEDIKDLSSDATDRSKALDKLPGLKFGESWKTPVAWLMLLVFMGLGAMATVTNNVNPMIQNFGFDAAQAAIALSCASAGNITGKLVMGWASDKRGAEFGMSCGAVMAAAGFVGYLLSFTVVHSTVLMCVSAFIAGNGACMATMMPPLVGMDAFGPKDYDRIYGFFGAIRALMAALMSVMVGRMVDTSGSYMTTLVFWLVAAILCIPLAYLGVRVGRKRWSGNSKFQPAGKEAKDETVA